MKEADRVLVIGGGASGMIAAIAAADAGARVCLIEKNEKLGKKLFITGKGRCNVTNAASLDTFFSNICSNGKFLYSAIYGFDNRALMEWLEQAGCPLKTERGDRVFPVSDHSSDVIAAFQRELKRRNVEILLKTTVQSLVIHEVPQSDDDNAASWSYGMDIKPGLHDDNETYLGQSCDMWTGEVLEREKRDKRQKIKKRVVGVRLADGRVLAADSVIVCTGGLSYPATGSTGDGYRFAADAGLKVAACSPSLVPFEVEENWCAELMGLSLKNVEVKLVLGGRELYRGFGEMLFTHFGVSGPLILSASSFYSRHDCRNDSKTNCKTDKKIDSKTNKITDNKTDGETDSKTDNENDSYSRLYIDLKPAMDSEQLDRRLLRDFEENKNRQFKNALSGLFPGKLIPVMVRLSEIEPEKKVNEVTREERKKFVHLIKELPLTVTGTRGYEEAIITQGGVSVKEINPSSMETRAVKGLFFAGEVLDVDAFTGGFNLQIAWSTGYLAGMNAARTNSMNGGRS